MFRPMDSELRIATMQAMEERAELGHELLGPDHLLLGLLSNVRGSAYKMLTEHGVTYEWARRVVAEKHDDSAAAAAPDEDDETASNLDEDREALRAIGIDLDKVRAAVRETFGEDITERWGQRRPRGGRGERRGHRGHEPRGHGPHGRPAPDDGEFGPWGPGFGPGMFGPGAFGPRGRGRRGPRRRFGRMSPSLRSIVEQLRDDMMRELHDDLHRGDRPRLAEGAFTPRVLAAVFASGDPVIEAIIEAADDPGALRAAVDEFAGNATA
ncbi:Clp protease N-terminal domain-containing protein [Flexivirga caeni]|uniref:Clp R domain-containing protein n=1 Tax=Flexivirga caeni TaxID=2294115 RepID=A0A3M9M593_9MICO|nr:Clp protease N-terminal domain-containing protein [Flexivirga caeni]RNI20702.1 hypothetical protein EFY87_14060 [Flexivirga caeni]